MLFGNGPPIRSPLCMNRPENPQTDIFTVDEGYVGHSAEEKIHHAAEELKHSQLDLRFISMPDVMMWLTNLRGHDLCFTPVHLCFGIYPQRPADLCHR